MVKENPPVILKPMYAYDQALQVVNKMLQPSWFSFSEELIEEIKNLEKKGSKEAPSFLE